MFMMMQMKMGFRFLEVNSDPKAKAEIESIAREFLGV